MAIDVEGKIAIWSDEGCKRDQNDKKWAGNRRHHTPPGMLGRCERAKQSKKGPMSPLLRMSHAVCLCF